MGQMEGISCQKLRLLPTSEEKTISCAPLGEDLGDALEDCCEVGEEGERRPPLEPDGEPDRFACGRSTIV